MSRKSLQLEQLNDKMMKFGSLQSVSTPPEGWIRTIRNAIGMSMEQLGRKLSVTKQSIQNLEVREKEGAVTINALRDAAKALDMQLVYGFVPNDCNLDELIEQKARALATRIVMRANTTMNLENQGNSPERLERAIAERTETIKREMPKILWD